MARRGIRVFGFAPGLVDTAMQEAIRAAGIGPVAKLPREKLTSPREPAEAIAFLCSLARDRFAGQELDIRNADFRAAAASRRWQRSAKGEAMLLEGKVAIVTGGSRGIGRGDLGRSRPRGRRVVINHYRGADAGFGGDAPPRRRSPRSRALGRDGVLVEGDVADPATVAAPGRRRRSKHFGGVDIHRLQRRHLPVPRLPRHAADALSARWSTSISTAPSSPPRPRPTRWSGPGQRRRDRRHLLDQRAGRRRHADALHADQGRRPLADAVGRHRARTARHPLQLGHARRHRDRHQPGRLVRPRRSAPTSTAASRSAASASPRTSPTSSSSSPPISPATSPAPRCWSMAASSSTCSEAVDAPRRDRRRPRLSSSRRAAPAATITPATRATG